MIVELDNGYNGAKVRCDSRVIEQIGESVRVAVVDAGCEYMTKWVSLAELRAAKVATIQYQPVFDESMDREHSRPFNHKCIS